LGLIGCVGGTEGSGRQEWGIVATNLKKDFVVIVRDYLLINCYGFPFW
jgi:hypothetical protein